ncbi:6898_t:CDS:2, partial [Racocetra fulgida]
MQAADYSVITDTSVVECDANEETNQIISIRGPDMYKASIYKSIIQKQEYAHGFGVAKSGLKFALENGLVDEFVGLITRFIENHTGIDTNERITVDVTQIKNPKKLKHKGQTDTENEYIEEISSRKRVNNE